MCWEEEPFYPVSKAVQLCDTTKFPAVLLSWTGKLFTAFSDPLEIPADAHVLIEIYKTGLGIIA